MIGAAVIGAGAALSMKFSGAGLPGFKLPSLASIGIGGGSGAKSTHSPELLVGSPFSASGESAESIDGAFQKTAVWRVVKREFPDWYADRVKETAGMQSAKRESAAVTKHLAEALVALRRKHADQALSAPPERVGMVAAAFLESLRGFAKHSVEACYGYISQGETNPVVLKLATTGPHADQLQKQVTAVFDAIADGRKAPTTYLPPRRADYDALAQELTSRGWSATDLQTFSDPRALARSTPEQVCKMVQDWFAAQMAIKDGEARQRLLVESLRPVVAG